MIDINEKANEVYPVVMMLGKQRHYDINESRRNTLIKFAEWLLSELSPEKEAEEVLGKPLVFGHSGQVYYTREETLKAMQEMYARGRAKERVGIDFMKEHLELLYKLTQCSNLGCVINNVQSLQQQLSMKEDDHTHTVLELKKQLSEKEKDIADLKNQIVDGGEKYMEEIIKNQRLKAEVERLKSKLSIS